MPTSKRCSSGIPAVTTAPGDYIRSAEADRALAVDCARHARMFFDNPDFDLVQVRLSTIVDCPSKSEDFNDFTNRAIWLPSWLQRPCFGASQGQFQGQAWRGLTERPTPWNHQI